LDICIGRRRHRRCDPQLDTETMITAVLGQDKWYSVLLATVVGVPMYADIFGTLPIAEGSSGKGCRTWYRTVFHGWA